SLPVVRVVRPRMSSGPRTMRYFSAPGLSGGAVAPAGRPAPPYTPVRSGCPSSVSGIAGRPLGSREIGVALGEVTVPATGSTFTVTARDGPPRIVTVTVVVVFGLTVRLPRALTAPMSWSIETPPAGFSVAHTSRTG